MYPKYSGRFICYKSKIMSMPTFIIIVFFNNIDVFFSGKLYNQNKWSIYGKINVTATITEQTPY